jgi:hypothetical protein
MRSARRKAASTAFFGCFDLNDTRSVVSCQQGLRLHTQVERWFAELTNKKLKRGTHRSVQELNQDIRQWIETWNENPRPYLWTKTADQIIESITRYCGRTNDSRH